MAGQVHYETAERIATITLDNAAALNAFDHGMCRELKRIWADVEANPEIACAIFTGAGDRAFCTGWDVTSLATGESPKLVTGDRWSAPYGHITALQNRCWKPVITAVNGVCNGGGLHFVADSELVIAAETATFLDTHVQVGLPSALEPAGLARRIPLERVFRLALLGKHGRIDREPGARDRPDRRGAAAGRPDAAGARARGHPGPVLADGARAHQARDLVEPRPRPRRRARRRAPRGREHLEHPDPVEGSKAFLEKRPPKWAPYRGTD